ncbi:MAG: hypothetical protein LBQ77_07270 [Treponema sp.]|nr:hypothetical protein [Treponema sp.]
MILVNVVPLIENVKPFKFFSRRSVPIPSALAANSESLAANSESLAAKSDSLAANSESFLANSESFLANSESFLTENHFEVCPLDRNLPF